MSSAHHAPDHADHTIVDTLQSLIVAFVLAMTFRGFVTEGFVIPTGSMAPTLLGQHKRLVAPQTGWEYAVGFDPRGREARLDRLADPILGPQYIGSGTSRQFARTRMGDRILVLKGLYPFSEPSRFDVVVFKNPTNPNGDDGNYIKRLIGLPNEAIWLADGDVFAAPAETANDFSTFRIQRKPEHVQRAVWQPVYNSDFYPRRPEEMDVPYDHPPWLGEGWTLDGPVLRCDTAEPTMLEWDPHVRVIDDWAPYNQLLQRNRRQDTKYVNDVRVAATLVPDDDGLRTTLEIVARGHTYQFRIGDGTAEVRMRSAAYGEDYPDQGWKGSGPVPCRAFKANTPTNTEFWHADQSMSIYVDGERVVYYEYDWGPPVRLQNATNRIDEAGVLAELAPASAAAVRWRIGGSPVTMERVRLDRDIFYRTDRLNGYTRRNPTKPEYSTIVRAGNHAYGTHPDNLAILGPDHFFMCGDNSPASSDSRLWGNPHPLVATQIDPAPFVVNRTLLLGKAWVVYFPSPHSITEQGSAVVPDFGRLRFIR